MSEPFLGQIIMFGGNFAPRGWALCDGQLLPISENSALFSILGTTYGGDGRTSFGLPELRGRFAMHAGNGPGLPTRRLGEKAGAHQVTLNVNQIPAHSHSVVPPCNAEEGESDDPSDAFAAVNQEDQYSSTHNETMGQFDTGNAGGGNPVSIQNPFTAVNFIIALVGTFPSRN